MAYRNKTYIAFDGDNDMDYYRMMTAWKAHDGSTFNFHNAHDLNTARDTSQEENIKRQLRERFANSKLFIILIGNNTKYLRKFVKWEMEVALRLDLPIIAVNLNNNRDRDSLCPATIYDELVVYIPYRRKIMEHAMNTWPDDHLAYKRAGKSGPFKYKDEIYQRLGL